MRRSTSHRLYPPVSMRCGARGHTTWPIDRVIIGPICQRSTLVTHLDKDRSSTTRSGAASKLSWCDLVTLIWTNVNAPSFSALTVSETSGNSNNVYELINQPHFASRKHFVSMHPSASDGGTSVVAAQSPPLRCASSHDCERIYARVQSLRLPPVSPGSATPSMLALMDDIQSAVFACVAVVIAIYAVRWYTDPVSARCSRRPAFDSLSIDSDHQPQINSIPTVGGSSLPGLSLLTAWRTVHNCREVLTAGYRKVRVSSLTALCDCSWHGMGMSDSNPHSIRTRCSRSRCSTPGWSSPPGGT